jgi:hypothetical protein
LILGVSDVSKTYDGTTSVTGGSLLVLGGTQLFGSDAFGLPTFAYADKNAGGGNKTVYITGLSIADGNGGQNYAVSYQPNTTSTITPALLTVSGAQALDKVYDGTTLAALRGAMLTPGGVFGNDAVWLIQHTQGDFLDPSVGMAKPVKTAMALDGADAGNYLLVQPSGLLANILEPSLPRLPLVRTPPSGPLPGFEPSRPTGGVAAPAGPAAQGIVSELTAAPARRPTGLGVQSLAVLQSVSAAEARQGDFVSVLRFDDVSLGTQPSCDLALPDDTFVHSNTTETLVLQARQADGSPLPPWLQFDPHKRVFCGTPAPTAQALSVEIVARDERGHEARTAVRFVQR